MEFCDALIDIMLGYHPRSIIEKDRDFAVIFLRQGVKLCFSALRSGG